MELRPLCFGLLLCAGCGKPSIVHAGPSPRIITAYHHVLDSIRLTDAPGWTVPATDSGYLTFLPEGRPHGALLFLQGARVDTIDALEQFNVVGPAVQAGLAVVFVASGNPVDFLFHPDELQRMDALVKEALAAAHVPPDAVVLAGLSLSGTRAMRYARFCLTGRPPSGVVPRGVVLCDAPLDMVRFWTDDQRVLQRPVSDDAVNEATWVNAYLEHELGGTPATAAARYLDYSPYAYTNTDTTALAWCRTLPLRAYHEPDVDWWLANRHKDYYSMNSMDMAGLVNELHLEGNDRAVLITSYRKRTGDPATTSPHTWSIIDPEELVRWTEGVIAGR